LASVRRYPYSVPAVADDTIKRRLVFSAWADAIEKQPFDRLAAADALASLAPDDVVLEHGEALTAVELIRRGSEDKSTRLRLLALHDAKSAPSSWRVGEGASVIDLADGRYSAFITHVSLWPNKIVTHDAHANAPGLGRLGIYLHHQTTQKVLFRALYEQGLADQLADLKGIRGLEVGIHSPHKAQNNGAGMVESLLPSLAKKVPSLRVSMGMGRRGARDAYLDPEVAELVYEVSDKAEQLFDSFKVSGKSKTIKTPKGQPKTVTINMLSQRLNVEAELPRDAENPSMPDEKELFKAVTLANRELKDGGALAAAVEARLVLDQQL
jgi:hypothetical protein